MNPKEPQLSVSLLTLQHFIVLISIPFYVFGTAGIVLYVAIWFQVELTAFFGGLCSRNIVKI